MAKGRYHRESNEQTLDDAIQHFVNAMGIPNSLDPFVATRKHFSMPPLEVRATSGAKKRRGGRRNR